MNLSHQRNYLITLSNILNRFCAEGRNIFYLEELVDESKVPLNEVEDFLIPLLKKGTIEGRLEVRCPRCGRDQGFFKRLSEIPDRIVCDICRYEFLMSSEYVRIVLEVKGEFFRDQNCTSNHYRSDSFRKKTASITQ